MTDKLFRHISQLQNWEKNPRGVTTDDFLRPKRQIIRLGKYKPLLITQDGTVIGGNMRLRALKDLGQEQVQVTVIEFQETEGGFIATIDGEKAGSAVFPSIEQGMIEYALSDNDRAGYYEEDKLAELVASVPDLELETYKVDLGKPIDLNELLKQYAPDPQEDDVPPVSDELAISQLGEVYQLGRHRIMCGDSTKIEDVEKLMAGQKADMVFTDPPYGMKKENEGVLNDNLNYEDLLEFNKQWIPLSFTHLKENGSWYCWGTDEPLMDIYAFILKPYIKENKVTFRNLITWDKGNGQGQNSEEYRIYAIADEKLLFCMTGVQGFNTNQDNYYEAWEPIRLYLEGEKKKLGWSDKWIAEQLNIDPRLHW